MLKLNSLPGAAALPPPAYAELHCCSAFSFGVGASHPEELVARAAALGYSALALTDDGSVAGVVRAHQEAKKCGLKLLPGASFALPLSLAAALAASDRACGPCQSAGAASLKLRVASATPITSATSATSAASTKSAITVPNGAECCITLIALAHDLAGWGELCEFTTLARRSAPKGQYRLSANLHDWHRLRGCELLAVLPDAITDEAACDFATWAKGQFGSQLWLGVVRHLEPGDVQRLLRLRQVSQQCRVLLVALGSVRMHVRSRKPLQDVLTAVRLGQPLAECGFALQPNAEAHLRSRARLAQLYPPEWLANTLAVAGRCRFSLDELHYHYPQEAVLPGLTPAQTLRQLTNEGAARRYPQGVPEAVRAQLEHELALIAELAYEMYFLTVHDIVAFARGRDILCQGRGSAANSAVCYCLGITEVDPARGNLLFERFISRERDEPPDIDVDFEHQRREEVIQYIYAKYGRDRAALTAVAISYRPRSALRDAGRALNVPEALISAMAREHPSMYSRAMLADRLQSALASLGADFEPPPSTTLHHWLSLSQQLQGLPRHLSQHPGGFVLTRGPLTRLVPVENAAMPERSVIQWDKDDLDALGLLKVDVLALGMLSAIRRCLELVGARRRQRFQMQDIPADDPATFDMICAADTVGVFQIESRAQMSMLPRLKPRCFYDLVVEVAIVRPGPIQGGMVHPYLAARANPQAVRYASPALQGVLQRTLGVPIFQEQVMQVAMAAADFSPGEADQLRRSMATWKRQGGVHKFYDRLVGGMRKNGYTAEFAEQLFKQIEGFGEYGFPESHAASFALLVWASCWLKRHEPACFLAALLNSQPLGFYGPSQLVQDAQRHGVVVLPVDVSASDWDCALQRRGADSALADALRHDNRGQPAVRLGLRLVCGLSQAAAQRMVAARVQQAFANTEDLALRAALDATDLKALASADALHSLSGHRRQQVWDASALQAAPLLLRKAPVHEQALTLPAAPESEEVRFDYAALGLTLRPHPLSMLRKQLSKQKLLSAAQLQALPHGRLVRACGLVTLRQSPDTANGVTFVTLEDETGCVNVIVWKALKARQRSELLHAQLLAVHGTWQRDPDSGGQVCHVVAGFLRDLTPLLNRTLT